MAGIRTPQATTAANATGRSGRGYSANFKGVKNIMENHITFSIPGVPVAKARPRFTRTGPTTVVMLNWKSEYAEFNDYSFAEDF